MNRKHMDILQEMLAIPTAPFAEYNVVDYINRFCAKRKGAAVTADDAGNLLIHVKKGRTRVSRPPCITAHMDHPGFEAKRMIATGRLEAKWRGGVKVDYFKGTKVRFHVGDELVRGRVRSVTTTGSGVGRRVDLAVVDVPRDVPAGSIGMWDLPEPRVRGSRIFAPACDDMAGGAAILCCIDSLVRAKGDCDAYFLMTRAEEVGFVGAMAAAESGTIPERCYVVCTETSSELPHARMGDGPVLRVGDRVSTFTSSVTSHCGSIAASMAARNKKTFKYQRKLMDGGMCEATAYCLLGCDATCICLALGNYHNMETTRGRIAPEYIDLDDFASLVKWFVALGRASSKHAFRGKDEALEKKLAEIRKEHRRLLLSTATASGPLKKSLS